MTQLASGVIWRKELGVERLGLSLGTSPLPAREHWTNHLDSQSINFLISAEWNHTTCPVQIRRLLWGSREIIMAFKCFENYKASQNARMERLIHVQNSASFFSVFTSFVFLSPPHKRLLNHFTKFICNYSWFQFMDQQNTFPHSFHVTVDLRKKFSWSLWDSVYSGAFYFSRLVASWSPAHLAFYTSCKIWLYAPSWEIEKPLCWGYCFPNKLSFPKRRALKQILIQCNNYSKKTIWWYFKWC
jgi:hypothetical protein